jgi:uncharacterized damage-inducible protein DinB
MPWTSPIPKSVEGPLTGPDRPILEGYLAFERGTLLSICAGLTGAQLASKPLASSNLSLLGLVRHMAKVERTWFRERAAGQQFESMYDPALGKNADFDDLDPAQAEEAVARLQSEIQLADEAVADVDFDFTFDRRGQTMSLRLTYVHMISEYARHNGHADLLREALDGVTQS